MLSTKQYCSMIAIFAIFFSSLFPLWCSLNYLNNLLLVYFYACRFNASRNIGSIFYHFALRKSSSLVSFVTVLNWTLLSLQDMLLGFLFHSLFPLWLFFIRYITNKCCKRSTIIILCDILSIGVIFLYYLTWKDFCKITTSTIVRPSIIPRFELPIAPLYWVEDDVQSLQFIPHTFHYFRTCPYVCSYIRFNRVR